MSEIKKDSIFNKAFEKEGYYFLGLKSGPKFGFKKRSEIWLDKTSSPFVTIELLKFYDNLGFELDVSDFIENQKGITLGYSRFKKDKVDVRYNDIAFVMEIGANDDDYEQCASSRKNYDSDGEE